MFSTLLLPLALFLAPVDADAMISEVAAQQSQNTVKVVRVRASSRHRHVGVRRVTYVVPVASAKVGVVNASTSKRQRRSLPAKPSIKRAVHR